MKVLILYCDIGGGHISAAESISEKFEKLDIVCDKKDALDFMPPFKRFILSDGHSLMYKHFPHIYGLGYRIEELGSNRHFYREYSRYAKVLNEYITSNGYDTVVCVHVFPAIMVTAVKRQFNTKIESYFVSTDYTCSPSVNQTELDGYFVPHGLTEEFAKNSIKRNKIVESGIPVKAEYYSQSFKNRARENLSLPKDKKIAILSFGTMGCGPVTRIAKSLAKEHNDLLVCVMCGNNKRLYKKTKRCKTPSVVPIGFTKQMHEFMAAADLLVSKAGGLTVTEAGTCGIPTVLIDAAPGVETHNIKYFEKNKLAKSAKTIKGICKECNILLNNIEEADEMKDRQRDYFSDNSADIIARCVTA